MPTQEQLQQISKAFREKTMGKERDNSSLFQQLSSLLGSQAPSPLPSPNLPVFITFTYC